MAVEIKLLGRFSVRRDGEEVPQGAYQGRLVRTLIRLLLTRRGHFVSRDTLAEALWPAQLPQDPVNNLNVLVNRARRALGDASLVRTGPGGYSFSQEAGCTVDAEMFLEAVAAARDHLSAGRAGAALRELRSALEGWGEPLAEDAYEAWAASYRSRLGRAYQEALESAAAAALALGDPAQAVAFAEAAVGEEPLREPAHLLLVRALAASGDSAAALAAFDRFRRTLAEELGIDPSAEAMDVQAAILRGEHVGRAVRRDPPPRAFADLPFVGRERELAVLLGAVGPGGPGIATVSGGPGTGKSRLLAELARAGRRPVLSVRAFLAERDEPWALARSLLRAVLELDPAAARAVPDRAAQALVDLVPELEELRPVGAGTLDPESRRALTLEGGVRLVQAVATRGALLLADDLQWADATSLALLRLLAQRVRGLGLVLASRPGEDGATPAAFPFAGGDGGDEVVAVSLEALAPSAIHALVDDAELAAAISEGTDRTPLAVAEVFRTLAREGAVEPGPGNRWHARSPEATVLAVHAARTGQHRALRERIDRQPAARRELLCLVALAGREVPARVLAAAAGVGQEIALGDLDALASAGLVRLGERGWGVAHDLMADAVGQALEPSRRGRLHAALARALAAEGADYDELARHLASAGDVASAAEALAHAARRRLESFATGEAARLAGAGLDLDPGPALRSGLLEVRAEARARSGDFAGARDDLRRALHGAERGPTRSRILARMAMLASGAEDLAHAGELGELAIVEAGRDPLARAGALSVGAILDMNAGRFERAQARFDEALWMYEELGDARGVATILDGRAMDTFLQGNVSQAVVAFDRVARLFHDSGDLLRVPTPRSTRGHALVFMGRPQEALADIVEALELARSLGSPENEAYALWHRSEALAALGRSAEAAESAHGALSRAEALGHREWTAAALRGVGLAGEAAGDLEGAEAAHRRSLATAENLSLFTAWACAHIALVLVARGEPASAGPFVERALADGPPISHFEARLARAEVAAALGAHDAAAIAASALVLAEARGHGASAVRLAGLAGARRGPN